MSVLTTSSLSTRLGYRRRQPKRNNLAPAPTRFESLLFLALMSGPPKFGGERELTASLTGVIDLLALSQIGVWAAGALWVFARLYPLALRRGVAPLLNPLQVTAWLLIAALSLSLP